MGRKPSYEELEQKVLSLEEQVSRGKQAEDDRRDLEIQLIQAQKMESLGTLAGGIAHDFNNILSPIIGYTEMMLADVPEDSVPRKYLSAILKATNRARDLVQQILAFSRPTEPERKPVMIQPMIEEALKLLRSCLPATIEIRQTIGDGFGMVEADPTQIHQMVMNLGTNAYHAMREKGGLLEVTLEETKIGPGDLIYPTMAIGSYLKLTVRDTGHGMERALLKRIFDPYYTTKKNGEGTGLGLSIVKGIVDNHGGTITVESEPDHGTVFHIYLPRIINAVSEHSAMPSSILPEGNEHILLVDDELPVLQMGKEMLENLGYDVTIRSSSPDAFITFRNHPNRFDIVITDMTMSMMTGDKLAEELLTIRPDIPIILCTGFNETISEDRAMLLGIREFIMKPMAMNQIANTLRKVLDEEGLVKPFKDKRTGASLTI